MVNIEIPGMNRSAKVLLKKGIRLNEARRFNQANAIRALEDQDASILFQKAASVMGLGKIAEAIDCYDSMLGIDSWNAETWRNKGAGLKGLEGSSSGKPAQTAFCTLPALMHLAQT